MIRGILLGALMLASGSGLAAESWGRFTDPHSGVGIDVPPGFSQQSDGGEGRLFRSSDGRTLLRVTGKPLPQESFSGAIEAAIAADQRDGWAVTLRSETPNWAAWSATRGGMILVARAILVCGGAQLASVRMTYPALDLSLYRDAAERVSRSLAQDGGCY